MRWSLYCRGKTERAGKPLERVTTLFSVMSSNRNTPEIQELSKTLEPKLQEIDDKVIFNEKLFPRIGAVRAQAASGLGAEQRRLVEIKYDDFVRHGAKLSATQKARLGAINQELARLFHRVRQSRPGRRGHLGRVETGRARRPARTAGRKLQGRCRRAQSPGLRRGQHALGGGTVLDLLQRAPTAGKSLARVRQSRRPRRQERHEGADQADHEAAGGAGKTPRLREPRPLAHERHHGQGAGARRSVDAAGVACGRGARQARGGRHAAAGQAGGSEHRDRALGLSLLRGEGPKAALCARSERVQEILRAREHDQSLVLHGRRLYGYAFEEISGQVPVFHPDVRVYRVTNKHDQSHVGLFYRDDFARQDKRSGAWQATYRNQHKLDGQVDAIVSNNNNFTKGAAGAPVLISLSDAQTLFHEFGHALHALTNDTTYPSLARTPRDFVEFPSQVHENWVLTRELLDQFARHVETGANDPFHPETALKFKTVILATGDAIDRAEAYREFRGRDPRVEALLKKRGFPTK